MYNNVAIPLFALLNIVSIYYLNTNQVYIAWMVAWIICYITQVQMIWFIY